MHDEKCVGKQSTQSKDASTQLVIFTPEPELNGIVTHFQMRVTITPIFSLHFL
jgi:hypothetical protein